MPFLYHRVVRFHDTDAAGVVYFANVLVMCHEAYEASLAASDIDLSEFFSRRATAVPIVHASVDFLRPMICGDRLQIRLTPRPCTATEFEIAYQIALESVPDQILGRAITRHVCIDVEQRSRQELSDLMMTWLAAWA